MVPVLHSELYDGNLDKLLETAKRLASGRSVLGNYLREGICLRVQHPDMDATFKQKSFEFMYLEGIAKSDDNYVDPEDVA